MSGLLLWRVSDIFEDVYWHFPDRNSHAGSPPRGGSTMMVTTHLLAGILLALPVVVLAPDIGMYALLGVAIGSILPDFDLYYGHRRSLHFPTYGMFVAPAALAAAILVPEPPVVAAAFVVIGAALHARMDIYGGGLELRPWEETSTQAVFDHATGRWLPPRRFVRYDGAPEDVIVAMTLAIPSLVVFEGPLRTGIVLVIGVSMIYGLVRKALVDLGVWVLTYLPTPLLALLPVRYLENELADLL